MTGNNDEFVVVDGEETEMSSDIVEELKEVVYLFSSSVGVQKHSISQPCYLKMNCKTR
ncbi:hypothetical protein PHET_08800 [Paragonimus heterotremus]|uniref:Uncharacterized protein n=1 Tax=Paragonimus heterotremus TaxID=100268 RepID=A0A8J4STU0_9TREM|nr:hypothetical protein PHET_08800 [Paragonimus heterotremus]